MKEIKINSHKDTTIALCLDTLKSNKQALVFCSSKKAAESVAENIAKEILKQKINLDQFEKIANDVENILPSPTKQCKRLGKCIRTGISFHHAGLVSKQREMIEDLFRDGTIKIICSTPTLAAGLDLPAFRAIIRDLKRFGQRGMMPIPVLEYQQMSGRAGRPGQEDYGEAIIIGNQNEELDYYFDNYVNGKVEKIYSKLAVEPVLRMYVLSLISSEKIRTKKELFDFFEQTFYAFQFGDIHTLHNKLNNTIIQLKNWNMLVTEKQEETKAKNMFSSGIDLLNQTDLKLNESLNATQLGKRISEIYIDPLTANILLTNLKKINTCSKTEDNFVKIIHLITCSLEIRPLLSVKVSEYDAIMNLILPYIDSLLVTEEDFSKFSTDNYENTLKTTLCLLDWANEITEDDLLEKYNVRPGELSAKLNIVDWLLYACEELSRLEANHSILKSITHARTRIKEGVKAELLPLLHFKGVGRIRARQMFKLGIKSIQDVVNIDENILVKELGVALTISLKEQVGLTANIDKTLIEKKSSEKKNKPKSSRQSGLGDFT